MTLNVSQSEGLKWRKPEVGDIFKFKLAPSETKVLVAKIDPYSCQYKAQESIKA